MTTKLNGVEIKNDGPEPIKDHGFRYFISSVVIFIIALVIYLNVARIDAWIEPAEVKNTEVKNTEVKPPDDSMKGTHKIAINENHFKWIDFDGKECGTVVKLDVWTGYAYEDSSRLHYFTSEKEAEAWLTKRWCLP